MPFGHLGPAGARRKRKDPAGNFGLNCDYFGQNCDMCLAHTRTRAHALYNVHPFGVHICTTQRVVHWSRERAEGEWTCDHEEKKNKSRPIMGAPAGHPYAHPEGVCINGLGALPSPYGPTLRGAHNGPSGLQKIKSKLIVLKVPAPEAGRTKT